MTTPTNTPTSRTEVHEAYAQFFVIDMASKRVVCMCVNPTDAKEISESLNRSGELAAAEKCVEALRKECARFYFPDKYRPGLYEALAAYDKAKEGK